ncbi:ribonuclease Y [Candidatus Gracilibacteria bacterium]|nr:ribonuclease Y [Candidatus Gracilibacteria bacterium]
MENIIYLIVGFALGAMVLYAVRQRKDNEKLLAESEKLHEINEKILEKKDELREVERKGEKILEEAKNTAIKLKGEAETIKAKAEGRLQSVSDKEDFLDKKVVKIEEKEEKIKEKEKELEKKITLFEEKELKKLEEISKMPEEKAKEELLNIVENRTKGVLLERINKIEADADVEFDKKAKKAITLAIQKFAGEVASESTVTVVSIEDDGVKGKVIGREGRNINSLEKETGVDIIIDDTPGSILISGFDLLRRHIAKTSLEALIEDGRIHPARIEEVVAKKRAEANLLLRELGEKGLAEMGITGIHPELVKIVGRLNFRTSYGQNILKHSIEVGNICGMLAGEIGMDQEKAKMAGFFHDIGKAVDHEVEGGHAPIGYDILKKYNISEEIAHAVGAHHEEMPIENPLDFLVCAADMISGSRVGARRDSSDQYIKRLKQLEEIAGSFAGVSKAFAIQAGREVRVMVNPQEIDDFKTKDLAYKIAEKIQNDMAYPGQIKVNVMREVRYEDFAK